MEINNLLFGQLLEYRYIGIKYKNGKIAFTPKRIELEIDRRLRIARNNNSNLFNMYWAMLRN